MAADGCKIRNYGSLARSAGGKDYYYNTFESHAVRCCSYDGSMCKTPTRYGCESSVSWHEAHMACHEMGMRMCSEAEIDSDKCCVTGCMFDIDKVWTSTLSLNYRAAQKNQTGTSCKYREDVSSSSTAEYGVVCCGVQSSCEDPVPGTCTMAASPGAAQTICHNAGMEICRDSRLCSRCKSTKCYLEGVKILTFKTYLS